MSQGLLDAIADAMRNAGASPQVMGAVFEAYVAWERAERPVSRQRKHADKTAAKRAWYQQSKAKRAGKGEATPSRPRYETGSETPDNSLRYDLRIRLIDASNGNIDPLSDISPIRSLIEQLRRVRVMKYETKPQQTDQTSGYA